MAFKMKGFKPHNMYKTERAETYKEHLALQKKGYDHSPYKRMDKSSMSCNRPTRSPNPQKKRAVKACEGGKEKVIHYGHTSYGHNYSTAARKSFRARHKCDQKKSKLTASYWACKDLWTKGGSKKSNPKGVRGKYS